MLKRSRIVVIALCLAASALLALPQGARAADKEAKSADGKSAQAAKTAAPAAEPAAANASSDDLQAAQQKLAADYKDLETILMRMRDLIRQTDPNRAALIDKALKESGERGVEIDLQEIVKLMHDDQLGSAVRKQDKVTDDMEAVLQLLLSEDRSKRLQDQKTAIRKYLERVDNLIRNQMDLQGRNLGGDDPKPLSVEQGGLAKQTGKLSDDIHENEDKARGDSKDDSKKGDPKNGDGKNDSKNNKNDGKDGAKGGDKSQAGKSPEKPSGKKPDGKESGKPDGKEAKPDKDGAKANAKADDKAKPGEGEKSQGKGQPSQSNSQSKSSKGKAQQGKSQSQGQEQDQDADQPPQQAQDQNAPPQEDNPVRKRLQAAEKHMEDAKKKLEKAQRDGAAEDQTKATEELKAAKAELEEILRQLREEEMKRLLAMLEGRMQKVLVIQREIYEGTVRLDKVPVPERSHGHEIESGRLSTREDGIVGEVKQVLSLLREEGSAVAMPVALEQARDDMQQLVYRLAQGKTEVLTQAIETDVIKELEEIVDALKKAQKDVGKHKPRPGESGQQGEPQDPPLIEMISELKMIRALQMRVNRRTERYQKLIKGEQAEDADVYDALQRLSEQQKQVKKVTRDLEMGKNE